PPITASTPAPATIRASRRMPTTTIRGRRPLGGTLKSPFPLAGKGLGMGVSALTLLSPLGSATCQPGRSALAPPPLTPPRKGEGQRSTIPQRFSSHPQGGAAAVALGEVAVAGEGPQGEDFRIAVVAQVEDAREAAAGVVVLGPDAAGVLMILQPGDAA